MNTKNLTTTPADTIIKSWFYKHRGDVELTPELLEAIKADLSGQISHLDLEAQKLIIHEYLKQNYDLEFSEMVENIFDEDDMEWLKIELSNFGMFYDAKGTILREIDRKNLTTEEEIKEMILSIYKDWK